MIWRAFSAIVTAAAVWAAYLQLNDPDATRWFTMYLAGAIVAGLNVAQVRAPLWSAVVAFVALAWAGALIPELHGRWGLADLAATMAPERPEIEYGRECGGLLMIAAYCTVAFVLARRRSRAK